MKTSAPWVLAGWPFSLESPPPGGTVLLAACVVSGVAGIVFATAYGRTRRPPWTAMVVHVLGGALAFMAGDLLTLLLAWEALSFSAFFLVASGGQVFRLRTAWRYLLAQMLAAAALFIGMTLHVVETRSLAMTVLTPEAQPFILFAVAVKAAAIPFHGWLVQSYASASPALVPLLCSFTTKVSAFAAARLLDLPLTAMIGAVMAVAGAALALGQRTARRMLAWLMISHAGVMLVGVASATSGDRAAGLIYAAHQVISTATLFMVAGAVVRAAGHDRLDGLGGLAPVLRWPLITALVASLSSLGIPPLGGFAGKVMLKSAGESGSLAVALAVSTVISALVLSKWIYLVFFTPPASPGPSNRIRLSSGMQAVMVGMAVLCIMGAWWTAPLDAAARYSVFTGRHVAGALWPPAAGFAIWLCVHYRLNRWSFSARWTLPLQWGRRALRRSVSAASDAYNALDPSALAWAFGSWVLLVTFFLF